MNIATTHKETGSTTTGRRHKRATADIFLNKIIGDEPHLARVRDISAGGLYLYKLLEPDLVGGMRVGLEMMLPNSDEVIWAVGEVIREEECSDTDGVAIRFVRIAEREREIIESYVDAVARDRMM